MIIWGRLVSWLGTKGGLIGRSRVERNLDDEAEFHLRARTDHWLRQGLPERDAQRRARIEFGGLESYREGARAIKGLLLVDDLRADLRYGWRQLFVSPVMSTVVIGTLAVGIGATTVVFSAMDAALWRSLPVERPADLREIVRRLRSSTGVDIIIPSFTYPVYAHLRDRADSFSDVFLFDRHDQMNVGIEGQATLVAGLAVSGNFVRGLGLDMALGRPITPDDDRADAPAVAVLTHRGWRRLFGGDPAVIGSPISINGAAARVIGVTAAPFEGVETGRPIDILAPLMPLGRVLYPVGRPFTDARRQQYQLMGRIRDGVSDDRARSEAVMLAEQAVASAGQSPDSMSTLVLRDGSQGLDSLRIEYGSQLRLLMAICMAILLIACANVAGILGTRASVRQGWIVRPLAAGRDLSLTGHSWNFPPPRLWRGAV